MLILKKLSLLLVSLSTSAALAGDLGQAWPKIIADLEKKGIQHIGDFNLKEFKAEAEESVTWKPLTSKNRPSFANNRRSAYFIIDKKTVYVSSSLPAYTEDSIDSLEFHEALGALNFNDQQYQMSSALKMLSQMENPADRKKLTESLGKTIFKKDFMLNRSGQDASGGSGSSVGGGGDLLALTAKNKVLKDILLSKEPVLLDFLKTYPTISFEPQYDPKQQYVAIKYQFLTREAIDNGSFLAGAIRDPAYGFQELISIYIPASLWQKGGTTRKNLIKELKERMLELFPAHRNTKLATYAPSLCENQKKSSRFPVSKFSDVAIIQSMRAGIVNGCDAYFPYTEVRVPSFEDTIPQAEVEANPRDATEILYACSLYYDKYKLTENEGTATVGRAAYSTFATMLPDSSILLGSMEWNDNGSLNTLSLFNNLRGKKRSHSIKVSAKNKIVSMKALDGHKVSFTCKEK